MMPQKCKANIKAPNGHENCLGLVSDLVISGIGLIPVAGQFIQFGMTGIKTIIKLYRLRANTFESKLSSEIINNFEELVNREEFVAKLLRIWNAVKEEHIKDKIELFSYLFNSTYEENIPYDEFDEYVVMLEDLSIREIKLLIELSKFNSDFSDFSESSMEKRHSLWKDHELNKIGNKVGLSKKEAELYFDRLRYKGMCSSTYGFLGQVFLIDVSPIYKRLLKILKIDESNPNP